MAPFASSGILQTQETFGETNVVEQHMNQTACSECSEKQMGISALVKTECSQTCGEIRAIQRRQDLKRLCLRSLQKSWVPKFGQ